jgi:putative hydrolase of the HAD superfamily
MIKNIIFDFGDVFINLDKEIFNRELPQLPSPLLLTRLKLLNGDFETGRIGADEFLEGLQQAFPGRGTKTLLTLWNSMLLDFPVQRLEFLEKLARTREYRLFLLSNTNELHIPHVARKLGESDYNRFRSSFEGFYLSHEIGLRKPNKEIFEFVLQKHLLYPQETLFIDDTLENIEAAAGIGLQTWHLQVGQEDITQLKSRL